MKITKSRQSNPIEQPPRRRICTSWIVPLLLLWLLPAGLGLMMAGRVAAQTFTTLYSFTGDCSGHNPSAGLVLSGNTLYGTTGACGGISPPGFFWTNTVFAVNADGTGFTNLHSFISVNDIGFYPDAGLMLSGNTLYGTASEGGSLGYGTVFAINTDGSGFTNLYSFSAPDTNGFNNDGRNPNGLILSGSTLYGTASGGGSSGNGTVFAVNADGTGFTTLHSFSAVSGGNPFLYGTNSDGANPLAGGLILSGSTLYGTASGGGSSGDGTVFAVNTDGTGFTTLHSFTVTSDTIYGGTNSDGANPNAGLILSGNTLYGTAQRGGPNGNAGLWGNGTVFKVNTDGTGFSVLHSFTFSDGAFPVGGLTLSGNTLYGTATGGGSSWNGTVFALNTDGTGFTVLHSFSGNSDGTNSDGASPEAGLILSGNTLYGTAQQGGNSGWGTVFSIFIQPQLNLIPSGPYVILTWPTNYSGFTLQSTTNLGSSAVWATNSPPPVVIGGQNMIINTTSSGKQKFFRLSQ